MNNKGQSIFGGVIIGLVLFIVGMVFLNFIDTETWFDGTDSVINQLDCDQTNGDISDGAKATCLIAELVVPYFIIIVIAAVGGLIVGRFIL